MVFADNVQRGPYSVSQLENFRRNGELPIDALVWSEGMTDWQPIASVIAPPAPRVSVPSPLFAPVVVTQNDSGVKESDFIYFVIAYVLMGISLFTGGLAGVVAVIMVYVKREEVRHTYLESHAKNLAEIFWWTFWISILGLILTVIVIGFGVILAVWIWAIYRVVVGAIRISERRAL